MELFSQVQCAARHVLSTLNIDAEPAIGVVLGTGLGRKLGIESLGTLPFADIPFHPPTTLEDHAGRFTLGRLHGRRVIVLEGRVHLYEGYTPQQVVFGIRLLHCLGARSVILTNAAGALNPLFATGNVMVVADHINLTGQNALTGPNDPSIGPRYPDMSQAYCAKLQEHAVNCARTLSLPLHRGVYAGVLGPSLETPAETRMLRILGADAVGMSTVQETIVARHLGMDVLCLSCLTNKNLPDCMQAVSIEEVVATAKASSVTLERLLGEIVRTWPERKGNGSGNDRNGS